MGDDKSLRGAVADFTIGAAAVIGSASSMGEAAIIRADIPAPVKDSAVVVIENFENAFSAAAVGLERGEDAAGADPVPEPEAADHEDPPDSFQLGAGWADETDSGWGDRAESDWSDETDPSDAAGDIGKGFR
jgi:hypothetical protein